MIWLRLAQGILCVVEICGLYYLLQVFFEKRWDKVWSNVLWVLSGVIIWGLTIYHRDAVAMYSRYFMFMCIVCSICAFKVFLKITLDKVSLITILYFESVYFSDIFLGYIGQALYNNKEFFEFIQFELNFERIVVMTVGRVILCTVLYFILRYKTLVGKLFSRYKLMFVGFAVLEYLGLFFCDQVFIPSFRMQERIYAYFALFPLLITLTLIVVIFYITYMEKRNEIQIVNNQNIMIEKNYNEMILLYQNRDRIFHDMKNHLAVLSMLITDKDLKRAEEYINKINEPILELEHKKFTGNRIVDIILNDKTEKAKVSGIYFNIRVNELKEGVIQDIDWCAILANVLDNAIEACCKIINGKKYIELFIMQNDCTTIIEISNSYDGNMSYNNQKLFSNKESKFLHGIGMESVRNAVDKYNGVFEYGWNEGIFKINISLFN